MSSKTTTTGWTAQRFYVMLYSMRKHTISFKHAWDGIVWAVRTQPNFRIHLAVTIVVLVLAWILSISTAKVLVLLLTISVVLVTELVNTAVESLTDRLVEGKYAKFAKTAKDVSAGAVLLSAVMAAIIGCLVFFG